MTREQLIEKIMEEITSYEYEGKIDIGRDKQLRQILESNLPQTTGVDALVEYWTKQLEDRCPSSNNIEDFIDDLKSLQQPTQTEKREVEIKKGSSLPFSDVMGNKTTEGCIGTCSCGHSCTSYEKYCGRCGAKIKRLD